MCKERHEETKEGIVTFVIIILLSFFLHCTNSAKVKFAMNDLDEGSNLVQNTEIFDSGTYELVDADDQPIRNATVVMRIDEHLSRIFTTNEEGKYFPQMLPEGDIVQIEIRVNDKSFDTEFIKPSESTGIKSIIPVINKKNTQALNAPAFNRQTKN